MAELFGVSMAFVNKMLGPHRSGSGLALKGYLRGAKARTGDELDRALAQAIKLVTKADIRGWFKHCGYSLARK